MNATINVNAQTWSALGTGMNAVVNALEVYDSNLVAGGGFTTADGVTVNRIASWNDANWSSLGLGTNGSIYALKANNNELIVGGSLSWTGGTSPSNGCVKWDGNNWYPMSDQGMAFCGANPSANVYALEEYNSEIFAGGCFQVVEGNITVNDIAQGDGMIWSAMPSGGLNAVSSCLVVFNSELYIGGYFTTAGSISANRIVKWDGINYTTLGSGLNNEVLALKEFNGDLYVGGNFTSAGGAPANYIAKWDGSNWSNVGSGFNNEVYALEVYNGELYAGGSFTVADSSPANYIAKWDGTNWAPVGSGMNNVVRAMKFWNNDLYVGGGFTNAGGMAASRVAKWNEPVGLKDLDLSDEVSVYPNPANNIITINHKNKISEVHLFDALGKQYDVALNEKDEMDVSHLREGIYFLQIKTSEGVGLKKIVVQR